MTLEEHTLAIGKILVNFHSLEFALRAFLGNEDRSVAGTIPAEPSLHDLQVGDYVPVNAFTNYDSLGRLIAKYNRFVTAASQQLLLDPSLVDLRDALAHGRVAAAKPSVPLRLLKFDRPLSGRARVSFAADLDQEWLASQAQRVFVAIKAVAEADKIHHAAIHKRADSPTTG